MPSRRRAKEVGDRWIGERSITREAQFLPAARLALGASKVYHGTSKLRREGPAQTTQMFESLGIRPGRFWAVATEIARTVHLFK